MNRFHSHQSPHIPSFHKTDKLFESMREKDALLPEDAKLGADFRRDRYADETLLIDGNGRVEKGTAAAAFQIVHHRRQLAEVELHVRREAEGAEGGCSLPGCATVLMPGEGYEGIVKFVMDRMTSYGLNACPPLLIGIGVGTSVETAALNSKKALMRPVDSHSDNPRAAKMEKLLEDGINALGLGPQGMGGHYSVMGVHIENTARHPSVIGCALNVGCWSHRRGHIIFDKDLNFTTDTHSHFVYEEK